MHILTPEAETQELDGMQGVVVPLCENSEMGCGQELVQGLRLTQTDQASSEKRWCVARDLGLAAGREVCGLGDTHENGT